MRKIDKFILKKFKILGENIKFYREKQNITLNELSIKTKIQKEYLKKIENGSAIGITPIHVFVIKEALNITFEEIFQNI